MINLFTGGIEKIVPKAIISTSQFIEAIKGDKYKNSIAKIRETSDKGERNKLKTKLDYITPGGTFSKRSNKNLVKHSGFLHLDIDNLPKSDINSVKKALIASKYTHILFLSPSGNGFKVFVKIPTIKDDIAYKGFYGAVMKEYNLPNNIDEKTKDISRACFMSHDPNIYHNSQSETFTTQLQPTVKTLQSKKINSELIPLIVPYWKSPNRNDLAMSTSGVLRKEGYGTVMINNFISTICDEARDEEKANRLTVVKETFKKNTNEIKSYSGWKGIFSPEDYILITDKLKEGKIQDNQDTSMILKQFKDFKTLIYNEDYIIDNFLYPGTLTMIHSPPANFKSLIAFQMGFCITNHKNFLDLKTKYNTVLYIDAENSQRVIKERMEKMYEGLLLQDENFDLFVANNFNIMYGKRRINEQSFEELKKVIEAKEIKVLIIDTLHRIADYDENKSDDINKLYVDFFKPLMLKYNLAIVFLHHSKKDGGYRGSGDFLGSVDVSYEVKRNGKGSNQFKIINEKQRSGEIEDIMGEIIFDDDSITVKTIDRLNKNSSSAKAETLILNFLNNGKKTTTEIIEHVINTFEGIISSKTVTRSLKKLKDNALIIIKKEGKFSYYEKVYEEELEIEK